MVQDSRQHSSAAHAEEHAVEHERPEDWGWHGEMGKWGRRTWWIAPLFILAYLYGNHKGRVEDVWLVVLAALMIVIYLYDRVRRKNAWRAK